MRQQGVLAGREGDEAEPKYIKLNQDCNLNVVLEKEREYVCAYSVDYKGKFEANEQVKAMIKLTKLN